MIRGPQLTATGQAPQVAQRHRAITLLFLRVEPIDLGHERFCSFQEDW